MLTATNDTTTIHTMKTFTGFCQQSDGTGSIWIGSFVAPDLESAIIEAKRRCIFDWNAGGSAPYDTENVHCLGIAAGDVEILEWNDICEV